MNCDLKLGDWMVVIGAGGGLGHLAGKLALEEHPECIKFLLKQ